MNITITYDGTDRVAAVNGNQLTLMRRSGPKKNALRCMWTENRHDAFDAGQRWVREGKI